MNKQLKLVTVSALLTAGVHGLAHAGDLSLGNVPLYLGGSVEPNIMFILDDSGSMTFEVTPDDLAFPGSSYGALVYPSADSVYGSGTPYPSYSKSLLQVTDVDNNDPYNATTRSPQFNTSYYNPSVTYLPWVRANETLYPNANPVCAWHNPENTGSCPTGSTTVNSLARNLKATNGRYNSNRWYSCESDGDCDSSTSSKSFWPATYFWHNGGNQWSWNNYSRVEIRPSTANYSGHGRGQRTDCGGDGVCSYDQEIQNFANWYTYYRSRILTTRAGIGRAFAQQGSKKRIGFATINKGSSSVDGQTTGTVIRGVREFTGSARTDFFEDLYDRDIPASGTPLRQALDDVGQYYSRTDSRGPWSITPGQSGGDDLSCRQSYSILMTDGYWSGGSSYDAGTSAARANVDNADGTTISGPNDDDYRYEAIGPFRDNQSNTLADVAMYYWKRDLRTDLTNDVANSAVDPAFWQHMTTFGVSFGLTGSIDPDTAWNAIDTKTNINWPSTNPNSSGNCSGSECPARLDDLLHASINGRGGFYSASNPQDFADAISEILTSISNRTSSASTVALSTGTLSTGSMVYQARFNSADWRGQLLSYEINDPITGELSSTPTWDAANLIPTAANRKIFTYNGSVGKTFIWSNLTAAQKTALANDQNILNYLRGVRSLELSQGGSFRNRTTLLGDIIHSSPVYAAVPAQRYPEFWGTSAPENGVSYAGFRANNLNRQPMIYVGANDGMLHAFKVDSVDAANDGVEAFSYIPASVYQHLSDLTLPGYNHQYYVDETPTVVDAFFDSDDSWRTILVSGLGKGGQGIFALDVTDPLNFDESDVLWEITDKTPVTLENGIIDTNFNDLGYTFGKPSIARMHNGNWVAVFSGGYNNTEDNDSDGVTADSTSGDAALYIVNIEDGSPIRILNTGVGAAEDPTGQNRPNGLSSPALVDVDNDAIVDYIYAGDLFGNVWKIDVSEDTPAEWDFSIKSGGAPAPLYRACSDTTCTSTNRQAITTQPQVARHPTGEGYMVLFGTGKYLEVGDNSTTNQVTQSFYGLWDKNADSFTAFNRSNLLQQQITDELTAFGYELRVTSENSINWNNHTGWYIDLLDPDTNQNHGERQVSNAIVRNGRIIFTTLLPSTNPCGGDGTSWLMELDANSGSRLEFSPFDLDGDRAFKTSDYVNVGDIDNDGEDDFVPVSGKRSNEGIISSPGVANSEDGQTEIKYTSGSSGNIEITTENPGPRAQGRQSWRELDFIYRRN